MSKTAPSPRSPRARRPRGHCQEPRPPRSPPAAVRFGRSTMIFPNEQGRLPSPRDPGGGVDLARVWTGVAAEVWRRHPGRIERMAARLLRSPGLARALVTTPSLLLPWLISTVVVFGVGALVSVGPGPSVVWLIAPA